MNTETERAFKLISVCTIVSVSVYVYTNVAFGGTMQSCL